MGTNRETLRALGPPTRELRQHIPEAWSGFSDLHAASMADGELPASVKELCALAIAVTKQCDGCIASHARAAAAAGATPGQVAEVLAVALLMNGGPATVYGPRAWAAYTEFAGAEPGDGA